VSRVLLTGGRAPVALELARQLAACGATVFVADSVPHFLAGASRAVTRAYQVPPPRHSPRAFASAIEAIVRHERITRIVPTCEEVFYLARFADQFAPLTDLFCPPLDVLRSLHDKWSFSSLAAGLGVEAPATWLLQSRADVAALPVGTEDLVFKPVFSRFAVHTLIRPPRMAVACLRPTPDHPWVAQRFVAGRELSTYSVARGGRLTAHAAYEPTWRAGQSSGFYFSPVDCPSLEHFTERMVARVGYTGQLGFDFIQSPDGTTYVLECNPRATSGMHLFAASDGLAAAFDGTAPDVVRPRAPQPRMLATAMLLLGPIQALRCGRLRQLVLDYRRARDAIWSSQDPVPAFYLFVGLGAYLYLAQRQHITPRAASTRDIEWDGEAIG
jgi:glutathione synthase/RimK-type ligase-like ATP-grasp enzyme